MRIRRYVAGSSVVTVRPWLYRKLALKTWKGKVYEGLSFAVGPFWITYRRRRDSGAKTIEITWGE